MDSVKNVKDLKSKIQTDTAFAQQFKNDPISVLDTLSPDKNPRLFRIVLYFIGFALIFSLIIAAIITLSGPVKLTNVDGKIYTQMRTVDQFFVMMGSAAIGAMAGLLVPRTE